MSNKEQIKDEIILTVKKAIGVNSYYTEDDNVLIDSNDIDHIAEQTAEALYNAGYRKTFTSDLASDTQKAYKEGYIKGFADGEEEFEIIKNRNAELIKERDGAKAVKEFAEKLKNVIHERDYVQGYAEIGLIEEIDELLKEYEK